MRAALYRKYRPDTFDNIIGQNQVIDVLKNQIKENKISHAYVFSGSRGTGKTSTAKVFAKAINCMNYDEEKGPCNTCESCINNYVDTVEIDAASNNSVDNIRQLKDTIMYQPTFGKYKTYIIDEVHMLSQGAFNALLKTLEEPPSHIVFILATTELQKIPATILSRCQKFEFKKVSADNIKSRLIHILQTENISYDTDAVEYISNNCDGGVRDAISMLDQLSSYGHINMENVDFVSGQSSIYDIDSFIENIIKKNSFECIKLTDKLIKSSTDIKKIPFQIISRLIDILYIQNQNVRDDIVNIEKIEKILNENLNFDISMLITDISELENDMKYSSSPEILFQAFIIKTCKEHTNQNDNKEIYSLLQKIEILENKIKEFEKNIHFTDTQIKEEQNIKSDKKTDILNEQKKQNDVLKTKISDIKIQDDISEEEKNQIEFVKSLLTDVNSLLKEKKLANLTALLYEGNIRRYINDTLYISYDRTHNFHKSMIEQTSNISSVQKAFSQILSKEIDISILFDDEIIKAQDKKDDIVEKIEELFGNDVKIEVIE